MLNDLSFNHINKDSNEGDYIFVTFSSWSDKLSSYFGESFFASKNIETFLIRQKEVNHWWHTEEMSFISQLVLERKKSSGKKIVLYGSSMGAYGSLHYRNMFEADIAIAIAPQVFVDRRFSPYETRWAEDLLVLQGSLKFDEIENIEKQKSDIYIFYDPFHDLDFSHIKSYKSLELNSKTHYVEVPYSNHDLARFLSNTGTLKSIITQIYEDGKISNDLLIKFSELYLDDHKAFFNYFRKASLSSEKDNTHLIDTMENHLKDLEKMDFEALYMVAETLSNFSRHEEALNISKMSIESYKSRFLKDAPSYLYGKYELILKKSKSEL